MNHPHEQQAAAMERAGELPDGEQLRECVNSGQVSAAQAVAHQEAGEITRANFETWVTTVWRPDDGDRLLRQEYPRFAFAAWKAALAAERAEVARLRDTLEANAALCIKRIAELTRKRNAEIETSKVLREVLQDLFDCGMERMLMGDGKEDQIEAIAKARAAITAPGEKHE